MIETTKGFIVGFVVGAVITLLLSKGFVQIPFLK